MALATRCPNCHALFRVAADQLKLRGGLVRCGACRHVFDATGTLSYIDDATLSKSAQAPAPAVGAVIAAIRKAESTVSETLSIHGSAGLAPAPAVTEPGVQEEQPEAEPTTATQAPVEVPALADTSAEAAMPAGADLPGSAAGVGGSDAAVILPPEQAEAEETRAEPSEVADETIPAPEPVAPAFLREGGAQKKRTRSIFYLSGVILLAALLLAQLAVAFRAEILVQFPQVRPALGQLCKVFRCTVNWPARGDLLAVVGSELQALPGTSAFELTAVVRNRGSMTLALPAIELTLSDTMNRTVARKVFSPTDYLAGESDPQARLLAGLEPGADLTVRIAFEARGLNAAGFVVYPFYL
jgi:predicted Zn finger-like uncharacterized protein